MSISNRDIIILAGDFNAKTGSSHENYPSVVGRYGKGKTNSNGEFLIEFALKNELFLTNTTFKHKMSHRTTWDVHRESWITQIRTQEQPERIHIEIKLTTL